MAKIYPNTESAARLQIGKLAFCRILLIILVPLEAFYGVKGMSPYMHLSILFAVYFSAQSLVFLRRGMPGFVGNYLSRFGRNSMSIFVMNPLVIMLFSKFDVFPLAINNKLLSYAASIVITILIAMVITTGSTVLRRTAFSGIV